jgi:hypothetical protein
MATIQTHNTSDLLGDAPAKLNANFAALNTDSHTHANKAVLDKITEGGGLPLWDGGAWPGGGSGGTTDASTLTSGTLPAGRLPAFTGDVASSAGSANLTLGTVNANVGSFGSGTLIPTFTVDAKGRITAVSTTGITPAWSSVTGKPTTLAGYGITDAAASGHSHSNATTSAAGFMSAADKLKLDGLLPKSTSSVSYSPTITPAVSADRNELRIAALTGAMLIANPTGTATDGMVLVVSWSQDATGGRAVSYGNGYVGSDQVVLASITTAANKKVELAFRYNAADALWVASALNTR